MNPNIESHGTRLVTALKRARNWPGSVRDVHYRETHISWVFLTGEYAYKIKKPVNFGFLDFSSLEKRKFYCDEELRLNRRFAPDIYVDVVGFYGDPAAPNMAGDGPLIEYAVRMRQFDPGQGFDELLGRGELAALHIDATAARLADFHAAADVADPDSPWGDPAAVFDPVRENCEQVRAQFDVSGCESNLRGDLAQVWDWSQRAFQRLHGVLLERKHSRFVRECHGDLHLGNIIYWQDKVIPFDCIEFSPGLRWIDVMSDLAFLLMDLDDHQRGDLCGRLLNAYLQLTGDYAGLQVLRFYQVYRAMVRCKVAALRLAQEDEPDQHLLGEVANYLALARNYTRERQAKLLITHGLSGSGKTYITQQLLEQAPLIRLRSDVERKRLFGLPATARSDAVQARRVYHAESSREVYEHLMKLAFQLLDWGYSVVVDAAFLKLEQRQLFMDCARDREVPFVILHCRADEQLMRNRIQSRSELDDDASDADLAVLAGQLQHHDVLDEREAAHSLVIQNSGTPDLEEVLAWLGKGG